MQEIYVATDNGSNMVTAVTKLGWTNLSCFGHNLNLAVTNAMKEEDRITNAIGVCKKVVQHFAHSWKTEIALQRHKFQKGFFIIRLSLIALLRRWGSQHKMISQILEQDTAIHMVLSDERKTTHLIPTWQDTMVLESVNATLSPVSEFTNFVSGEKYFSNEATYVTP